MGNLTSTNQPMGPSFHGPKFEEMSLMDFADMCALTNLDSADFNSSLQLPGPKKCLQGLISDYIRLRMFSDVF